MAQKELEKEKHEQEDKARDQAYQMRSLEETTFLEEVESLNKIITEESEKENSVVSVVIETKKTSKNNLMCARSCRITIFFSERRTRQ